MECQAKPSQRGVTGLLSQLLRDTVAGQTGSDAKVKCKFT